MKNYWFGLPLWLRKVIVAALETGALAFLVYVGNVIEGTQSWSTNAMALIVLKAIAQSIRVNPNNRVNDYVNSQSPQK
jgi:hypothetical protein